MRPPDHFETPRLQLRPPTLDDAEAIFIGYAQDAEVTRYLIWKPHPDIQATRAFLAHCASERQKGTSAAYAILRKSDGRLIGMLDLGADGGVGYVLEKRSWGQGLMSEALRAVVQWGLGSGELKKMWAHCDAENPVSARVMQKAGMTFEKLLPRHTVHPNISAEPRDMLRYTVGD